MKLFSSVLNAGIDTLIGIGGPFLYKNLASGATVSVSVMSVYCNEKVVSRHRTTEWCRQEYLRDVEECVSPAVVRLGSFHFEARHHMHALVIV